MARGPRVTIPAQSPFQNALEWAAKSETQVDQQLAGAKVQRTAHCDLIEVVAMPPQGPQPQATAIEAAHELEIRYRSAGWDEVTVDLASGILRLKQFHRRVYITVSGSDLEISAPVYEEESHQQAIHRLLTQGARLGISRGSESGVHTINPQKIVSIRIPVR